MNVKRVALRRTRREAAAERRMFFAAGADRLLVERLSLNPRLNGLAIRVIRLKFFFCGLTKKEFIFFVVLLHGARAIDLPESMETRREMRFDSRLSRRKKCRIELHGL